MALRTDAGRREGNEDSVLSMRLASGALVIAVADGMGGLELGDVASRTALQALRGAMTNGATLEEAVQEANRAVHVRASGRAMGTTLVAALAEDARVTVANVGDSRAYRCTPLGLRRITVDHTHGEEARQAGAAAPTGALADRWASALTRSLGTRPEVEVDVFGPFDMDDGECVLLCSDGVHGVLTDEAIERWSQDLRDLDGAVEVLLRSALDTGSEDNVSAVALHRPSRGRGVQSAALRRKGSAWDPRLLVERSPVPKPSRFGVKGILLGLIGVAAAVVGGWAVWMRMQ
ncbi:MAG: protein phosphatase 2C domain-containing protein [Gemmatimonadetes bacterium]|nr:protein phosphatase 2C domain-containing protein [Gemmatimonadota bacterium]MBT8403844.1 protein phosphatase 2C domain-containing protein [Gemmatimonadota bacterium]NNF38060.1 serine/threonine-protein phosphatase [Gemmatimonadota bacterium]